MGRSQRCRGTGIHAAVEVHAGTHATDHGLLIGIVRAKASVDCAGGDWLPTCACLWVVEVRLAQASRVGGETHCVSICDLGFVAQRG